LYWCPAMISEVRFQF